MKQNQRAHGHQRAQHRRRRERSSMDRRLTAEAHFEHRDRRLQTLDERERGDQGRIGARL